MSNGAYRTSAQRLEPLFREVRIEGEGAVNAASPHGGEGDGIHQADVRRATGDERVQRVLVERAIHPDHLHQRCYVHPEAANRIDTDAPPQERVALDQDVRRGDEARVFLAEDLECGARPPVERVGSDQEGVHAGRIDEDRTQPLEVHRRYIDIQYSLTSPDVIGWKQISTCRNPAEAYNEVKDIQYFLDAPDSWVTVPQQSFGVFFPEDAHAPMAADGPVHKVVVKVAVDWQ